MGTIGVQMADHTASLVRQVTALLAPTNDRIDRLERVMERLAVAVGDRREDAHAGVPPAASHRLPVRPPAPPHKPARPYR